MLGDPVSTPRFNRPGLIRQEVYEHLKRDILEGRIPSGERLAEEVIAAQYGVSRTPIREAVQRLAQDGLVEVIPNKGARVRAVSAIEVAQTYTVREALEGLAARLAAEHRTTLDLAQMRSSLKQLEAQAENAYMAQVAADLEFHASIANASRNDVLIVTLRGLHDTVARVKVLTRKTNLEVQTRLEHHAILDAIVAQDADAAETAARAHVRRFRTQVLSELQGASHAEH